MALAGWLIVWFNRLAIVYKGFGLAYLSKTKDRRTGRPQPQYRRNIPDFLA